MNQLYRCFDIDEETPVQFVGVHPLKWRPAWGEPTAMFREAEDAEIAELPEVRALIEAAQLLMEQVRHDNESEAEYRAIDAELGVSEWESFMPTSWHAMKHALAPFEEVDK